MINLNKFEKNKDSFGFDSKHLFNILRKQFPNNENIEKCEIFFSNEDLSLVPRRTTKIDNCLYKKLNFYDELDDLIKYQIITSYTETPHTEIDGDGKEINGILFTLS